MTEPETILCAFCRNNLGHNREYAVDCGYHCGSRVRVVTVDGADDGAHVCPNGEPFCEECGVIAADDPMRAVLTELLRLYDWTHGKDGGITEAEERRHHGLVASAFEAARALLGGDE